MTTWNFRVMKHQKNGSEWVSIHEVYHDSNGKPHGFAVEPVRLVGNDPDELRFYVDAMIEALDKPVIDLDDMSSTFKGE